LRAGHSQPAGSQFGCDFYDEPQFWIPVTSTIQDSRSIRDVDGMHILLPIPRYLGIRPVEFSLARLPHVSRLSFHRRKLALSLAVCAFGGIGYLGVLRPYLYMNNPLLLIAYTVPEAVQQKAVLQHSMPGFRSRAR
jgi:hypothetical protein